MSDEGTAPAPPTRGIFITKGMRVGIPAGGLKISMSGTGDIDTHLVLHAALDVTPHWLGIAVSHLTAAERAHSKVAPAWQAQNNDEIRGALEAEFTSSMQAMMAAAIAIDAFYAAVKERLDLPASTLKAWREKGTTRHRQVYEVVRRGFKIGNAALPKIEEALREIYRFRDLAVHPDPKLSEPLMHPDLTGVGTEWRFIYFRYENAKPLVNVALSMVVQLLDAPKERNKALSRYAKEAAPMTKPLVDEWESRYGALYPRRQLSEPGT